MHKLEVEAGAARCARECAVEAAAVLGFRSVSLEFPLLSPAGGPPPGGEELLFRLGAPREAGLGWSLRRSGRLVELGLRDAASSRDLLFALLSRFSEIESDESFYADSSEAPASRPGAGREAEGSAKPSKPGLMESGYHPWPKERGLESLFEREYLVKDEDYDFLPDRIDASLALPEPFDEHELSAACDLAARLGMESLGLELPILEGPGCPRRGSLVRIEGAGAEGSGGAPCSVSLAEEEGRRVVALRGSGPALAAMASSLCRSMPGTGDDSPLAELLEGARRALAPRRPGLGAEGGREPVQAAGREIELPWELEACRAILEREVYPRIGPGPGTELTAVIGEGLEARRALESEMRAACEARGALGPRVRAIGAFKQGFSWLRDCELPELAALGGVDAVEIGFSAFLPEGRSAWNDEDGATPRIAPNRPDDPEAWLDAPIRLLQELYPIDDLLAAGLGIPRDRVTFRLGLHEAGPAGAAGPAGGAGARAPGYSLVARGRDGRVLRASSYAPAFSERPYLDDFPGIGKVHPGTGLLRLSRDGEAVWEGRFDTDMESVWKAYQGEILPAARAVAERGGALPDGSRSLFSRLVVEVEASEPDEELGCRHDRLSSLESLHEDLYFAGLDYFQTLGIATRGKGFDSPGLILPVIRGGRGRPRLRYSILVEPEAEGAGSAGAPGPSAPSLFVDELSYDEASGRFSPRFRVEAGGAGARAALADYARTLSEGGLEAPLASRAFSLLRFSLGGSGAEIEARLPEPRAEPRAEDLAGIAIPEEELIGPEAYEAIAERLGRVRGLRPRKVGESLQGRPIRAFELAPKLPGYASRTKLVASRPTLYVNGRHHANEVSSTNSALMLLKRLLSDPAYERLTERLNLVVLPLENADGAAIHEELARENPEWILHAARYDAQGGEFARSYFDDGSSHPEARAYTRIWRDWLPDVVADDHGVPSHEWCQQFSGYTSPWFKGFWMPRALLYGYFWYVTDEAYAANKAVAEGMQEAVAERLGARPEFASINAQWRERFEKYAHAWMPKLFPAEYHRDMIFYWVPYAYKPDYYYASVRFPWVTASSFVSEVADETAVGPYLGLCARAHLEEDLAIIDLLAGAEPEIEEDCWVEGQTLRARRRRRRPLSLPARA